MSWYDDGDFGLDLVMVGIFVVIMWQFCWAMLVDRVCGGMC